MMLPGDQLRALAAAGAKVRIEEIRAELTSLETAFPELSNHQPLRGRPRKRVKRSDISARMKARWAAIKASGRTTLAAKPKRRGR